MTEPCTYYLQGNCRNGANCRFLHANPAAVASPCTYFLAGSCSRGASCRFLHGGLPAADYVAAAASGNRPPRPTSAASGAARPSSAQRPPRPGGAAPPLPFAFLGGGAAVARSGSAQRAPRPESAGRRPPPQRQNSSQSFGIVAAAAAAASSTSSTPASRRSSFGSGGGNGGGGSGILGGLVSRQQDFMVRMADGRVAAGQMKVTQQVVVTKPPLVVHAYFLLDASGSMSGSRMAATLEYLAHMVKVVLDDDDLVTIWTFSSEEKLTQLYYKARASNLDLPALRAKVKTYGNTRLYDNCVRALDSMRKDDRVRDDAGNTILRNLIVFTDGCDNESGEQGLRAMVSELRNHGLPHFFFTCMAVSEDGYVQGQKLQKELAGAKRARVILTDKASKEEIGQAFGKAQACLREAKKEIIERIELECRSSGTQPVLSKVLAGVASSMGRGRLA